MELSTELRNAQANQLAVLCGTGGKLVIKEHAPGTTVILTFNLADPALSAASNGTAALPGTLTANASANTVDDGNPLVAEWRQANDTVIARNTVGITGGSEEILLGTGADSNGDPEIVSGQEVDVTAFNFTIPAGSLVWG